MKSCSYKDCVGRYKRDVPSYFRFPKDRDMCIKWCKACKRSDFANLLDKPEALSWLWKNRRVCSEHFREDDFMNRRFLNKGLKPAAVPSQLSPEFENFENFLAKFYGDRAGILKLYSKINPERRKNGISIVINRTEIILPDSNEMQNSFDDIVEVNTIYPSESLDKKANSDGKQQNDCLFVKTENRDTVFIDFEDRLMTVTSTGTQTSDLNDIIYINNMKERLEKAEKRIKFLERELKEVTSVKVILEREIIKLCRKSDDTK